MIPYGKQSISKADIDAVIKVLNSEYLTQGPAVPEFENVLSTYCNSKFSVAVCNATAALHLACMALEVGIGDIVWTSPITFVASANCALYCGATVDFVDIDPVTYNISIEKLSLKLKEAKSNNRLPKVIIVVHLAGQSCEMKEIAEIAQMYDVKIIEDASHAIGGSYKNSRIGSCEYSDITVFSFHPVKIITTGEGGALLTNNEKIYNKIYRLRSHGIVRHADELMKISDGPWYYEQIELGYNYRITDIQAALGISQITELDNFVKKRNELALKYDNYFSEIDWIKTPKINKDTISSFHLYIIRIPESFHKKIFEKLRISGIMVNLHYIPIYRHPFYSKLNYDINLFPEAELYYKEAISLPMFTSLSDEMQKEVVDCILNPLGFQNLF